MNPWNVCLHKSFPYSFLWQNGWTLYSIFSGFNSTSPSLRTVCMPSKCRAHTLAPNVHLGDVISLTSCRTMATHLYYHTIAQCHPLSCWTQSKVLETVRICCPIHVPWAQLSQNWPSSTPSPNITCIITWHKRKLNKSTTYYLTNYVTCHVTTRS